MMRKGREVEEGELKIGTNYGQKVRVVQEFLSKFLKILR